jgi:hypothetical protein
MCNNCLVNRPQKTTVITKHDKPNIRKQVQRCGNAQWCIASIGS